MIGTVCKLLLLSFVFTDRPNVSLSNIHPGDKLAFSAIYSLTARRFGFQLMNAEGNAVYRLAFRHTKGDTPIAPCTVLSTWYVDAATDERVYENWENGPLPAFTDGELFKVEIECLEDSFKTYFNGALIEGPASNRSSYGATLDQITKLELWGGYPMPGDGNVGIYWKSFCLPVAQHNPDPADGEGDDYEEEA